MHTFSKQQISQWALMNYLAEKQVFQEKNRFYEAKYSTDFQGFEKKINLATEENFEAWDDYIEWQAYQNFLREINHKIEEIRHGDFQMA